MGLDMDIREGLTEFWDFSILRAFLICPSLHYIGLIP